MNKIVPPKMLAIELRFHKWRPTVAAMAIKWGAPYLPEDFDGEEEDDTISVAIISGGRHFSTNFKPAGGSRLEKIKKGAPR